MASSGGLIRTRSFGKSSTVRVAPTSPATCKPGKYGDKRRAGRAKIARTLRVRPSEPKDDHFEDLPMSVNASKQGLLHDAARCVLRRNASVCHVSLQLPARSDELRICREGDARRKMPNGRFGVALSLLMTVNSVEVPMESFTRT